MHAWLATVAVLVFAEVANAQPLQGRVISVPDGDTITVQTENKRRVTIRLQGIDAPERSMAYSQISRRHLHELVMGRVVTFDPEKLDRHGRTVAVVRLHDDGTDACLAQIQAGLAWHFKRYELEQPPDERAAYAASEVIARATKRGLWRDDSPIPPWEFRASNEGRSAPAPKEERAASRPRFATPR